jgi:hypothetical protein
MPAITQQSDSLIGSLCREMESLRRSWRRLAGEISRCREERLILRLQLEGLALQRRQLELQQTALQLRSAPLRDPLGVDFLLELAGRPLGV